jgi:2-polyprenyl-6-methoxyphenol hydroxylase-like FAD-dependent oxidoreductase
VSHQYDLVIVGGGLGGASLARCMAAKGARVLVLERETRFKDRVRGEFVTSWGVAEAKALGILDLLTSQVARQIRWADFYSGPNLDVHRDVVETTPCRLPCITFYHPAMQELLLAAAADAGAEVNRGVTVHGVQPGSPARVFAARNGAAEEITARLVVGADGRSSGVRASAGFAVRRDPENLVMAGVLMDDVPAPDDTAHLIINSSLGYQAVIFPQGKGRARIYLCFHAGTQPRFQGLQDLPRLLDSCQHAGVNPEFYRGAKPAGPLATFDGAEVWVDDPYSDGVALIGDAAAATDPSWGQGLGMTLRDVRVLRDQLHDRYHDATHMANNWYSQLYLDTGPEADARRARAMPLIAQDPSRQPDTLFSGPDMPLNEEVRRRFFAEDEGKGVAAGSADRE